ncbi:hypothetical protein NDU88_001053 [Pleurodeles waltl]|uniref:Uncharacterized protein n=1 Tax=Pleurodeles waltl TaxID=8319 RepID=A0AAV7R6R3_PLEWA|nr:hypothetical protein NDU88_001053 [Pleurodeles waltl]
MIRCRRPGVLASKKPPVLERTCDEIVGAMDELCLLGLESMAGCVVLHQDESTLEKPIMGERRANAEEAQQASELVEKEAEEKQDQVEYVKETPRVCGEFIRGAKQP